METGGGGYCILLILGIYLIFTISGNTQVFARTNDEVVGAFATTDLGHGSGCQHTHSSGCYIYHDHVDSCYGTHTIVKYNTVYLGDYAYCAGCGHPKAGQREEYFRCIYCGKTMIDSICPMGGHKVITTPENFLYTKCYSTERLVCKIPDSTLNCTVTGYTDCVMPSTTIQRSTAGWTNQDVTCTGQCPTFMFTDGNPQTVVFTSSSGHRVQETITSNVDKLAPDMPTYQIE